MIYFIQDELAHHIKIGFTDGDPTDRMKALQTGSPIGLTLLYVCDGNKFDEQELHQKFSLYRLHGEWFKPAPSLIKFIIESARDQAVDNFKVHAEAGGYVCLPDFNSPQRIVAQFRANGFQFRVEGDKLLVSTAHRLTPAQCAELRAAKPAVIAYLNETEAL